MIDPYTLQVTLERPTPYFSSLVGFTTYYPVPKHRVEKYGDQWIHAGNMVSNGPFKLVTHKPNKIIAMEKNSNYYDSDKVKLDVINFHPVPDVNTAEKMYDNKLLDVMRKPSPIKVRALKGREDYLEAPYLNNVCYLFNTTKPPFDNKKVRQAMTLAIDPKIITDKVLQTGSLPMNNFVPPGIPGYIPAEGLQTNIEKAKALFQEAGYGPGGKAFPEIELLYSDDAGKNKMVAEAAQNMWKNHLGITVKLRNEEWKSYNKSMQAGNFQITRFGWVGDYLDPNTFLDLYLTNGSLNYGKYSNPEYDKLIKGAAFERNAEKRFEIFRKAEGIILEDAALIPLYADSTSILVRPYVKGYYSNVQDWHPLHWVYIEGK